MILTNRLAALAAVILACLAPPGAALARQDTPAAPPPAEAAPATAPTPPAAPPATPEEIAAASAEAEAALAKAKVGDLFENVTDDKVPTIRHRLSGMECDWDPGNAVSIHIYDGSARGEDVSCGTNTLGITVTLYATRYPERPTARQIVEASFPAIAQNFTDVKNYEGAAVSMNREGEDQPQIVTARMTAKLKGKEVFTRSSAVVIGDWVIAQRVTGPLKDAMIADLMAELDINATVTKMLEGAAKTP